MLRGTQPSFNRYLFAHPDICRSVAMNKIATGLLAVTAVVVATGFAQAQAPNSKGCTPQERGNQALNQSNGVICPPDVDPAMKAPTPKTGDSSAIPPPGSPGGNSNVQPK
jgi:hypothetical protein